MKRERAYYYGNGDDIIIKPHEISIPARSPQGQGTYLKRSTESGRFPQE